MKNTFQASNIAKNIKQLKKEMNISKSELVRRTGLDYHTIVKIENGATPDPRINTVLKIAKAFKISIDKLVK